MNHIKALSELFKQKKYALAFAFLLLVLAPIFAITSDILVPSTLELNPIAEMPKIVLVLGTVVLIALNLTVFFHNYEAKKNASKKTTALGAVAALFTTACPVCQPIWLVWLGLGSASAFLTDISLYVGFLSVSLLLVSLHYSLKSSSATCEITSR